MSATALRAKMRDGRRVNRRLVALWHSPVARALALSRLLVLAAGVAGGGATRRDMWTAFDATQLSLRTGRSWEPPRRCGSALGCDRLRRYRQPRLHGGQHGVLSAVSAFDAGRRRGHRRPPAGRWVGLSVRVCRGALAAGPGDRRRTRAAGVSCGGCPAGLCTVGVLLQRRLHRVALPGLVARLLSCRAARSLGVGVSVSVPLRRSPGSLVCCSCFRWR